VEQMKEMIAITIFRRRLLLLSVLSFAALC
jgi:hypothetical protein